MGVGDRCTYVPGDMFREVPPADVYLVKRVIHDWNDEECLQMLSTMHRAAPQHGRVLIIEQVVPGPDTPHFSKLFDIHMLIMLTGRERTLEEYTALLEGAGWTVPADVVPGVQDAGGGGGREGLAREETRQRGRRGGEVDRCPQRNPHRRDATWHNTRHRTAPLARLPLSKRSRMMADLRVTMNTGAETVLGEGVVEAFRASLRGPLLRAGDAGYDEARTIWNGMIDRRPALIARCAGVADVIQLRHISPGRTICWWRCAGAAITPRAMRCATAA